MTNSNFTFPLVVIDFEATALTRSSYPIEVGVAIMRSPDSPIDTWSSLIAPDPGWDMVSQWDPDAERLHGISPRDVLGGANARNVMERLNELVAPVGHAWCDGGDYDHYWLGTLSAAAGVPPQFELRDINVVIRADQLMAARYRELLARSKPPHRAGPDSERHCAALATLLSDRLREPGADQGARAGWWTLYHFPMCPFSRKVRLVLAEKDVDYELCLEHPWERRDEFVAINPLSQTPVLRDAGLDITLIDSRAICEYFEETIDRSPMITGDVRQRAAIRAAAACFDERFHRDVTAPLMHERMRKRMVRSEPPDSAVLREAIRHAVQYLTLMDDRLAEHEWLVGRTFTLADIAAYAQISVADELLGIDWSKHPPSHRWFERIQSRPAAGQLVAAGTRSLLPREGYAGSPENDGRVRPSSAPAWHEHDGGDCPVEPQTPVLVRFRKGQEAGPAPASDWRWKPWSMGETDWDIIAWRLA